MSRITRLGLESFEPQVMRAACPVLVAFLAAACPVCQLVGPLLEELARRYGDAARIVQVDVQATPELARQLGIQSVPTALLFDGGIITHQFIGALPKSEFLQALERALLHRNTLR